MKGKYIHTDCLNPERGLPSFPDNYFNLAIVDPPYGINEGAHRAAGRGKLARTMDYKKDVWDQEIPSQEYFDQLFRVSQNQIIWGINYFVEHRNIPIGSGRLVWDKVNPGTAFSDCEIAGCSFHHSTRQLEFMWNGMMQGKSISEGRTQQGNKKLNEKRIHPTQKPVLLYRWILQTYAKTGNIILDTHVGSASSLIACEIEGFQYIGFENSDGYYQSSLRRLKNHCRQLNLFVAG